MTKGLEKRFLKSHNGTQAYRKLNHVWGKYNLNTGDLKKQVQRVIVDHKWYEENHAKIPRSSILIIQWLAWYLEVNEKVELSS